MAGPGFAGAIVCTGPPLFCKPLALKSDWTLSWLPVPVNVPLGPVPNKQLTAFTLPPYPRKSPSASPPKMELFAVTPPPPD